MILSYLFSAEKTPPPTKIVFFRYVNLVDLWENGSRYRNGFNRQLLRKWVWAFQWHQNQPPNLTPFLPFRGSKTWKRAKNGFYHFQMMKLCGEVFPIKNFQRQCYLHMSERHERNNFRNRCIITLCKLILVHPLNWRKCANFKRLYFLNGCIDLDVRYTVGKVRRGQILLGRCTISKVKI